MLLRSGKTVKSEEDNDWFCSFRIFNTGLDAGACAPGCPDHGYSAGSSVLEYLARAEHSNVAVAGHRKTAVRAVSRASAARFKFIVRGRPCRSSSPTLAEIASLPDPNTGALSRRIR